MRPLNKCNISLIMSTNFFLIFLLHVSFLSLKATTPNIDRLGKIILSEFENNQFNKVYDIISVKYKKQYTPEYIALMWNTQIKLLGNYKKRESFYIEKSISKQSIYQLLKFRKGAVYLKLNFNNDSIIGIHFSTINNTAKYRTPSYGGTFFEKEVNISSSGDIILPGTLTCPTTNLKKRMPLVILVHGSGPANRDEELGPNKPFKDIAIGLASKGISTLRYEKRTLEYEDQISLEKDSLTIYDETINDAVNAAKFITQNFQSDSINIFFAGHSLGGMCMPKIAELFPDCKGIILLAAPARKLEESLADQMDYLYSLDSSDFMLSTLRNTVKYQIKNLNSNTFSIKTKSILLPFGLPAKYWLSLKEYDQIETFKKTTHQTLILQGERDYQVTLKDYDVWATFVNNKNLTLKLYPKLNHLFFEGEGKSSPSEYLNPSHVAKYVITDISDWIWKQIKN